MTKIRTLCAAMAVVLATALGLILHQPRGVAPTVPRSTPPQQHIPVAAPAPARVHSGHGNEAAPILAQNGPSVLPEGFQECFPGVVGPIARWNDFRPATLTVAPYPDLPITFTCVSVREDRGSVVWIGRNPAMPGASYVGIATPRGYDGVLIVPGASQFSFHVHGGPLVVKETAPGEETCGADVALPFALPPLASAGALSRAASGAGVVGNMTGLADSASPSPAEVDVLFLYDLQALTNASTQYADPIGYFDGNCRALIESCNLVLQQSGVTQFTWRYAGVVQAPAYKRTGILFDDLTQLSPGGAIGDWVAARRYEYSADQVLLLVGGNSDSSGWANLAAGGQSVDGAHAIAVMRDDGSYRMLAHELAHNFGCRHDRANSGGRGVAAPEGNGLWCYGWLWTDPPDPANPGAPPTTSGTIMAYSDYVVPYFSNPNITLQITPSLEGRTDGSRDLGSMTIGWVESSPKAAYNARILNDNAASMVNISPELTVPAITAQPQDATVTAGQTLTLSVAATGGGLRYQWNKNGTAISGATAALFTISAAASGDAGDYSVQVDNRAGSVASSTAKVTIVTGSGAPAPPTPTGGGGGGATSPAFILALLAVSLVRLYRVGEGKPRVGAKIGGRA